MPETIDGVVADRKGQGEFHKADQGSGKVPALEPSNELWETNWENEGSNTHAIHEDSHESSRDTMSDREKRGQLGRVDGQMGRQGPLEVRLLLPELRVSHFVLIFRHFDHGRHGRGRWQPVELSEKS